ncbi:MAG TPA: sugar ABC transporter permease [Clostridiales bacterium]|nr:sugar ABC transporter permease [Clostridiales bacterium]
MAFNTKNEGLNIESAPPILKKNKKKPFLFKLKKNKSLLIMTLPVIVFFFIFSYIPMPGIYLAFIRYNYNQGIFKSPFIGFENFRFLIQSGQLATITINTVLYNLAFILLGNCLQIFVAVLLNEVASARFKKITQTVMFLPYFISAVIVGLLAYNFLNYDYGFLNVMLKKLNLEPLAVYSTPSAWPFIIVLTNLWQGVGYGSIVYFAQITSIDSEIVEAAAIDGVNAFQRIRYIILPWLKPTFILLLLFSLGGVLKGNFGLFYNLVGNNSTLFKTTDIIETFVFRSLMINFNFSMSSAVSLYQSFFGCVLVLFCNWLVKKIEPDYSLF